MEPAAANPHRARLERAFRTGAPPFPSARRWGLRLLALRPGYAALEVPIGREHHNPLGIVHGGFLLWLVDTALGFAATTLLVGPATAQTIDLKVNFVRSVERGRLRAVARALRRGRTVLPIEVRVTDAQGRLVAMALGTALVVAAAGERKPARPTRARRAARAR